MDNLQIVLSTPLEKMDNIAITLDNGDTFGFVNWDGIEHRGRYYGNIAYRAKDGQYVSGQGTSAKGYASKENAFKAARVDFENMYKERILENA